MSENVSLQWRDGIAVFTVLDVDKDTIDEWTQEIEKVFMSWDDNKPILTVHDFSNVRVQRVTSHLRQQTRRISRLREDLPTRTAIIMPPTIAAVMTMMTILVRSLYHTDQSQRERRVFSDMESAIAWVRSAETVDKH